MKERAAALGFVAGMIAILAAGNTAFSEDVAPATPETIARYAGNWQVTDAEAAKACAVTLGTEEAIGGYVIDVAEGCAKAFPVMDEIAAWRMFENGDIVFADATRNERLRFYTPDENYISVEEVDGIVHLTPASQ